MAVVIRLQGLPVVAGSVDIRHFFSGLNIPGGGVHIIGGKHGEAFIIFTTDEDARRAVSRTGGLIKKSHVQLFLSSKAEMQDALEMNQKGGRDSTSDSKHSASKPTGDMSKLLAVIKKGIHQNKLDEINPDSAFDSSGARHADTNTSKPNYMPGKKEIRSSKMDESVYVFLFGLPYSATVDEVRDFFHGLCVDDMIFLLRTNGLRDGNGLVKFATANDANAALKRNNEYMGHRFISVKKTKEEEWINAGGHIELTHKPIHQSRALSPKLGNSYDGSNHTRSKSQNLQRGRSRSPHSQQFYIHLKKLSPLVDKRDIKIFLGDPEMEDSQITFILKHHSRIREAFVMLKNEREYQKCLGLHKQPLTGRPVALFPITRKSMLELIESYERQTPPKMDHSDEDFPKIIFRDSRSSIRRCLYVRNFPFDVLKSEVQKFFVEFPVNKEDISLLYDNKGVGLGEALVKFPTVQQAITAEGLNRQQFLGTEVLLRRISEDQMKEFGLSAYTDAQNSKHPSRSPAYNEAFPQPVSSHGPSGHSFELSDDFRHGSGEFINSPEMFINPSRMGFGGEVEPFGRLEMGDRNIIEYNNVAPNHQSFVARSSGGTAIYMKNLPFTATTAEILDFFYGYRVIPDSVDIKFIEGGLPAGIATVCLENYEEALAAVNELNDRPVGSRKVCLSLMS